MELYQPPRNNSANAGRISMTDQFDNKGRMVFPLAATIHVPKSIVTKRGDAVIVTEAFCSNGHSLMSKVLIESEPGLHFIYTNKKGTKETDIVISPVVRKSMKKILRGIAFKRNEIVKILCPTCRTELPILFDCECGAPIYLFYLDRRLQHSYGQSFCSRIGCTKASQLRFSQDVLNDFISEHGF